MRVIIKIIGAILTAIITTSSLALSALNINPSIPWIWIAFISFLFFVYIVGQGWYVSETNFRKLANSRPSVKTIKEIDEKNYYYLEIKNEGCTGEFTAQIEVIEDTTGRYKGKLYMGYWVFDALHYRSEIQRNHSDRLRIAHCHDQNINDIHLDYYDPQSNCLACLPFSWENPTTGLDNPIVRTLVSRRPLPECVIKVIISSKPDLQEGSIERQYKLNVSELQNKLDKTPKLLKFLKSMADQKRYSPHK
jgi:hypothetical protein